MELKEKLEKINEVMDKNRMLNHAIGLLQWDLETEAPKNAVENIGKTMSYLSGENYSLVINDEFKNLVTSISDTDVKDLDKKVITEIKEEFFEKLEKLPKQEYQDYSELLVKATSVWTEAKQTNNYEMFKDTFSEVIEYNKRFIKYRGYNSHPYNVLLNDYEKGLTVENLDIFFENIKNELVPFINKVLEAKKNSLDEVKSRFSKMKFDIDKQKKLSKDLLNIIGFDFDSGIIKESEHPFTTNFSNKDVRVTTHYYEESPINAIFSTIHEGGHAIYEQHIDDKISNTILGTGSSMSIHESQSRLYENMFGRNYSFVKSIYPLLDEEFALLKNEITVEDFYKIINDVNKSLIRIEADELTYAIHVLIRYEIEKEIFSNLDTKTDVDKLAEMWDSKYEEYLGIRPSSYSEGILQDVHWSSGLFGYFPSYVLGSAYAAQIYNAMGKVIDIDKDLKKLDFKNINNYLKKNIHQYGKALTPDELLVKSTGESFDSKYFVNYLKEKYTAIYNIKE